MLSQSNVVIKWFVAEKLYAFSKKFDGLASRSCLPKSS